MFHIIFTVVVVLAVIRVFWLVLALLGSALTAPHRKAEARQVQKWEQERVQRMRHSAWVAGGKRGEEPKL